MKGGASKVMRKQAKSMAIFVALLLLAGIFHVTDVVIHRKGIYFPSTLMFSTVTMIYSGLILFWVQSVRIRLLPSHAKNDIIASGLLMLLFHFVRSVRYRMMVWSPFALFLSRHCWYFWYVPIIMVPTLFLTSSLAFGKGPEQKRNRSRWILIPAILLGAGIMTNDLHCLAFLPNSDIAGLDGKNGTYTHQILFYAAYIWAGCMMAGGIAHRIILSRKMKDKKQAIRPFLCLLLVPVFMLAMNRFDAAKIPVPYRTPELLIFCMIGIMEACIRNRLLPHNENYADFFAGLELPVSITDKQLTPLYQTSITVTDDRDTLQQAVGTFVYPEPDTRLSGIELNAGYTFFAEDESVLHRLNEELQDANEVLSIENEVLAREQELLQEKAAIEERNRLYDKAAQEIHPAQKRISELLEKLQPNTPSFRQDMARVLFMTAYVKRKANFVMLHADHGSITPEDMTVALKESLRFLNYCGIETDARITISKDYSYQTAAAVYDCFEAAGEALCGKISELWMRLTEQEMLLLTDAEQIPKLPELPLPVACTHEDGQTVIRITIGGDAQ